MSWARLLEGDVYVFPMDVGDIGYGVCCACPLVGEWPSGDFRTRDLDEMLAHLDAHRAAGHEVPERTED